MDVLPPIPTVGSSQGIREMTGEYVWIDEARASYLQDKREVLKNKDWKDGFNCLE